MVRLLSWDALVMLDLSGVKRLDSSAVRLIVAAHQTGRLTVTGATAKTVKRFDQLRCSADR